MSLDVGTAGARRTAHSQMLDGLVLGLEVESPWTWHLKKRYLHLQSNTVTRWLTIIATASGTEQGQRTENHYPSCTCLLFN